jgi:hypothetical protein
MFSMIDVTQDMVDVALDAYFRSEDEGYEASMRVALETALATVQPQAEAKPDDALQKRVEQLETVLRNARKVCGRNIMNCHGAKAVRESFDAAFPDEPMEKPGKR